MIQAIIRGKAARRASSLTLAGPCGSLSPVSTYIMVSPRHKVNSMRAMLKKQENDRKKKADDMARREKAMEDREALRMAQATPPL